MVPFGLWVCSYSASAITTVLVLVPGHSPMFGRCRDTSSYRRSQRTRTLANSNTAYAPELMSQSGSNDDSAVNTTKSVSLTPMMRN